MGRVLLVIGMVAVLIMGCSGGNSSTGLTTVTSASDNALMAADAPSIDSLHELQQVEFARLGVWVRS